MKTPSQIEHRGLILATTFYWVQKSDAAHFESARVANERINVEHEKMIAAMNSITELNPKGMTDVTAQAFNNFKAQVVESFWNYTNEWSKLDLLREIDYVGFTGTPQQPSWVLDSLTTQALYSAEVAVSEQCTIEMMLKLVQSFIPFVQSHLQVFADTIEAIPAAFGDAKIVADQSSRQISLIVRTIRQCNQAADRNGCVSQSVSQCDKNIKKF